MKEIIKVEGKIFNNPKLKIRTQSIENFMYELIMVIIFTFIVSAGILVLGYEIRFLDIFFISCLITLFRK